MGELARRGGQTTSGLFFVLRGLWPVALGAVAPFPTKAVLGQELRSPVLGEEKDAYRKSSIMQNYLLAPLVAPKGEARKRTRN